MKREFRRRNVRDWAWFVLGLNTGLRISDILSLRVRDVINPRAARLSIARRVVLKERKTGKARNIPLNSSARSALAEYLRETKLPEHSHLFPSREGKALGGRPISRDMAYKIIRGVAQAAGIFVQVGTHTMRKTWGYTLYQSGEDLARIQRAMNHRDGQTTLIYIGITQDQVDRLYLDHKI